MNPETLAAILENGPEATNVVPKFDDGHAMAIESQKMEQSCGELCL